ncbi:MAG: BMP family ABC transporter substrate-binding protein [Actinomycetota bacterium]
MHPGAAQSRTGRSATVVGLCACVAALMLAAACTADPGAEPEPIGPTPASELTVALVLAPAIEEGAGDFGAVAGLERAIDAGVVAQTDTKVFEPNAQGTDRRAMVRSAADEGFDLVIAIGAAYTHAVDEVARDHRRQLFAIVGGGAQPGRNVADMTFRRNDAGFLAGAAAAMKSKSGLVGFVGGQSGTGLIEASQAGFEAGAREVDSDVGILVAYVGEDPTAFADPGAAQALAATMYANGADVIAHDAGASGAGVFAAAADTAKLAIGADVDETLLVPPEEQEAILTSAVDRIDVVVEDTIRAAAEGTFVDGSHSFGLAQGGVDYAVNAVNDTPRLLSEAMQLRLDEVLSRVASGEIVVPTEPELEPELPAEPTSPPPTSTPPTTTPPTGSASV